MKMPLRSKKYPQKIKVIKYKEEGKEVHYVKLKPNHSSAKKPKHNSTEELLDQPSTVTCIQEDDAGKPIHEAIKPLSWLLGKWKGEGKGIYPNIEDFNYVEELEFFTVGQPMLQFSFYSVNKETNRPLHREVGFLRIKPGTTQLACISSHNNGVSEMAEGTVNEQTIELESHTLGRMSFGKDPQTKKLKRTLTLKGDTLQQVLFMETNSVPMTEHLRATYKKVV